MHTPRNGLRLDVRRPEADLVGDNDKNVIVKHFAGPTWQATDGSTAKKDPLTAASRRPPTPTAIPWLLLKIERRSRS